ncbi:MAG: 5-(carboxyamino)imidazole ribonucleotide mutase [Spirochaetaceae bacterium]|jgi:5-(carboxyamino)imidazole ribonucleotide mutase|nr:5-(carboxyamino)imidazole ribonucleotide mutase [Spirochaetaceae bacterium]
MNVVIILGSRSDLPVMKEAAAVLDDFGVDYRFKVVSAHRTPHLLLETVHALEADDTEVIIAGAGLAAHLPGIIASYTTIPVVGVPLSAGSLGGIDALLSIVQMPKPIPVAAVGINNAANAAYMACHILSLKYPKIKEKLKAMRAQLAGAALEAES